MSDLDLSKIQLPADDANKPAELDFNPAGDEAAADPQNDPAKPVDNTIPEDNKGLETSIGPSESDSQEQIEEPKASDTKTQETPAPVDPEKKEETPEEKPTSDKTPPADSNLDENGKPVDFHNHPDWKKREDKLHEVELEKAKLEGKIEVMEKKGIISEEKKEEAKSAAQLAEDAVLKKREDGWEPKDALELNRVFSEEFEKALDQKAADKEKQAQDQQDARDERRKEIQKEVDAVYTEFGITDESEQNKVADLAMKWANEGTANWSLGTLKLAADHLKAKGEIGKAVTPTPTPAPVADPAVPVIKDDKADINKKISKPTSEGGSGVVPQKRSIDEMRRKSLDDIVLESAGALG